MGWYSENDPGCTLYSDMGQFRHCQSTRLNCDDSRLAPDPLITTCSLRDLCDCFEGCDPPELCPLSETAQSCEEKVSELSANRVIDSDQGAAYLEWDFGAAQQVL